MPRPEFPHCPLPSECIARIRQEQDYYDSNPERYEQEQLEQEQLERKQLEQEQLEQEQEEIPF